MKYDISFIGLGKLGLPLATNFAKCKKKVLAWLSFILYKPQAFGGLC